MRTREELLRGKRCLLIDRECSTGGCCTQVLSAGRPVRPLRYRKGRIGISEAGHMAQEKS
jgi:hypothetical protein